MAKRLGEWCWIRSGLWKRTGHDLWIELDRERSTYIVRGTYRGHVAPDIDCGPKIGKATSDAEAWMKRRDEDVSLQR